ncbi:MAG: PilZ domain-containing protein [Desulfatitalea sp.]|nr:PilZ domain-containing protein [Desulfatitalea sp.]
MITILYIEEKPHVRENVIRLLTGPGDFFKVLTAGTVVEAIDLIERIRVDLVIAGRQVSPKEIDLLDNCLRQHVDTRLIVMADRKSHVASLLKAFEYKMQFEVPVDIGLLLERLLDEFGIDTGGQLRGISIASFLQMIELEGKTCTVKVLAGGRCGHLYCESGEVIDAQMEALGGKEAAFALFGLENALIMLDYNLPAREKTIHVPLMSLLLESGRIKDEQIPKPDERRRYKRFPCALPVEFVYNEWAHQGVVSNISLSGVFLQTKGPFSVGQEVQVAFFSQSLNKGCRIAGVIMRRDAEGIGIKFAAASINQMAVLRTVIHEVSTS